MVRATKFQLVPHNGQVVALILNLICGSEQHRLPLVHFLQTGNYDEPDDRH